MCHIVAVHDVDKQRLDGEVKCPHYVFPYGDISQGVPEHKRGCGWCKWQSVSYQKQLDLKNSIVLDAYHGVQGLENVDVFPILPSPLQFKYRNKIEFSFGKYLRRNVDGEGFTVAKQWNAWFHKQGEFSKVIDVDQCFLVSETMHSVYARIKHDLQESWLPVYDVKRHEWLLRHLVIREWVRTGQLLVNISMASAWCEKHPKHQKIFDSLVAWWQNDKNIAELVTTLVITHNDWLADIVNGRDSTLEVLWWPGSIFEWLQTGKSDKDMVRFQVSPFSFFQTNTLGAEVLFHRAAEMVWSIDGNIIDLYCWSGTIGIMFHAIGIGNKIHGIDIVESAIFDAQKNAIINGVDDCADYHCWKAEQLVKEWVINEQCFVGDDLIVIDPPRQGMHKDVISFLSALRKQFGSFKLLYISCNPVTMARDVAWLQEGGFTLKQLQPVDIFPHTHHIETIGLLG